MFTNNSLFTDYSTYCKMPCKAVMDNPSIPNFDKAMFVGDRFTLVILSSSILDNDYGNTIYFPHYSLWYRHVVLIGLEDNLL